MRNLVTWIQYLAEESRQMNISMSSLVVDVTSRLYDLESIEADRGP
jgi:hypothetical protein